MTNAVGVPCDRSDEPASVQRETCRVGLLRCVSSSSYLAATVLIRPESELFILCANTLKKAFLSKNKVVCFARW